MTRTRSEPKLSVAPRGHWRNRYRVYRPIVWQDGRIDEPGVHWGDFTWPTREIAEQKASEGYALMVGADPNLARSIKVLMPVFFPDD